MKDRRTKSQVISIFAAALSLAVTGCGHQAPVANSAPPSSPAATQALQNNAQIPDSAKAYAGEQQRALAQHH